MNLKSVGILFLSLGLVACSNGTNFGIGAEEAAFDSTIKYNNKVDIVWLVDDSSSMQQHQVKLANEVNAMIAKLNELGGLDRAPRAALCVAHKATGGFVLMPRLDPA